MCGRVSCSGFQLFKKILVAAKLIEQGKMEMASSEGLLRMFCTLHAVDSQQVCRALCYVRQHQHPGMDTTMTGCCSYHLLQQLQDLE